VYEASPLKPYITKIYLRYTLSNERNCDEVEKCQALFQNDLFETAKIYSHALLIRENLYEYLTTSTSAISYRSKFIAV
jgi:Leucine-rich repeat (LRR) protein